MTGQVKTSVLLLLIALSQAGCGPTDIDDSFGRSRGSSINGTSTLVELFRQKGHEVRVATRFDDGPGEWADVVVRFSSHPGPPDAKLGKALMDWAGAHPGRQVIYVPRDYDAGPEFWAAMLAAKAPTATPEWIKQVERNRDDAKGWASRLPSRAQPPASPDAWFAMAAEPGPPAVATTLDGPWAEGVDAKAAAIARHETFVDGGENPLLLDGDGRVLAMTWTLDDQVAFLAVANGSFLLNGALVNPNRRALALRVVEWVGDEPKHVAFVDGPKPLEAQEPEQFSVFHLLKIDPFHWIAAHLAALGLLAALARAVRLGRPRPEPPSGVERPAAHPEALGGLLARTRNADAARDLLDAYRRWRHPSTSSPTHRVHRS